MWSQTFHVCFQWRTRHVPSNLRQHSKNSSVILTDLISKQKLFISWKTQSPWFTYHQVFETKFLSNIYRVDQMTRESIRAWAFKVRANTVQIYRRPMAVSDCHSSCLTRSLNKTTCDYRPRSEGDNALGSVRVSIRLRALSRLNRLTAKSNKSHHQFKGTSWGHRHCIRTPGCPLKLSCYMYRFKGIPSTWFQKLNASTGIGIVHLGPPDIPLRCLSVCL